PDWRTTLIAELQVSTVPGAAELHRNLTDPARTAASHRERAHAFVTHCADPTTLPALSRALAWRSEAAAANDISQTPRGQILEPGFRVIFTQTPLTYPRTHLSETCEPEAR